MYRMIAPHRQLRKKQKEKKLNEKEKKKERIYRMMISIHIHVSLISACVNDRFQFIFLCSVF